MISPSDRDDYYDLDTELGPDFVADFIDLLMTRKRRHRSIKHLDVRGCAGDLRMLDSCTGLKVTWLDARYRRAGSPGEYVCGSGNRILDEIGC